MDFELEIKKVDTLWEDGKYFRVIELLTSLIELFPYDDTLIFKRGYSLLKIGELRKAELDLNRAIGLNKNISFYYCVRGRIRLEKEAIVDAQIDFGKAIFLNKSIPVFYFYYAICSDYRRDHLHALEYYTIAEKKGFDVSVEKQKYRCMIHLGKYDDALVLIDKMIDSTPSSSLLYLDKAIAWYKKTIDDGGGEYHMGFSTSLEYFNKSIELNPDFAFAFYNRGLCFMEMRSFKLAEEDFSRAINIDPTNELFYKRWESAVKNDKGM